MLLLEAGGDPPPATVVPFFTPLVQLDPSINNFFKTNPPANDSLCCNRVINKKKIYFEFFTILFMDLI